jgi:hypothetical protein
MSYYYPYYPYYRYPYYRYYYNHLVSLLLYKLKEPFADQDLLLTLLSPELLLNRHFADQESRLRLLPKMYLEGQESKQKLLLRVLYADLELLQK